MTSIAAPQQSPQQDACIDGLRVRVFVGAQAAYACISTPNTSLDVQLLGAMGAPQSLRRQAQELREKAEQYQARAYLIEQAALALEQQG